MENKLNTPKIWFTSDCHISHKNVIKHCPGRALAGNFNLDDIEAHDNWLIDKWNTTINKKDIVYIIGDFCFANREETIRLLGKLNGDKHLILGNHDKSSDHLFNYFKSISQIKEVKFRKSNFSFLEEDFDVIMCHYHMINWNRKHYGSVEICGHSHGRLDDYNLESPDLRVDVGIDGKLANYEFISLEKLYNFFKEKAEGKLFADYAREKKNENMLI